MTPDGGQADERTSYGLQPPDAAPTEPFNSGHDPTRVAEQEPADPGSGAGPAVGRVLGGRYRLISPLGKGGMGTVWLGHDDVVDRDVAVKEPQIPGKLSGEERSRVYLRLQREARAAARIDHPSVVTIHDVVVEDDKPWIVMELVRGRSLGDLLAEKQRIGPQEAARIGLAVLGALVAAQEKGVLHRDVKPDNILLGRADRVVLSDFGIAQVEGEESLTRTGEFIGSPEFAAPERVMGRRPGPESDLWSLGVVLYLAVEGRSPFRRDDPHVTLEAVRTVDPQPPSRSTGPLGTLIMQLLRKEPASRPDAEEVREALVEVAWPDTPPPPPDPPVVTGFRSWIPPVLLRSRGARYGLGGGLLAVALVLLLIFIDPFGDGLPEGWRSRSEKEILHAEIAVPDDDHYRRDQEEDYRVTYSDLSGVFWIAFARRQPTDEQPLIPASVEAYRAFYESGGTDNKEYKDVKVSTKKVKHQSNTKAFEAVVDYTDYASKEEHPVRHRLHQLVVPGDNDYRWLLTVTMPADGAQTDVGEKIFAEAAEHFDIEEF